jgi:hypothetical protein
LPQLIVSALLRWASASGVPGSIMKPVAANFSCKSFALAAALIVWLSLLMMSGGVPAGANTAK